MNDEQRTWAQLLRQVNISKRSWEPIETAKDLIRVNEDIRRELQAKLGKTSKDSAGKT